MEEAAPALSRKAEHSAETQRRLIEVARQLFAERGYAGTGTEHLVAGARMTRGALYHHYRDKRDLFRAVSVVVAREYNDRILRAAATATDPWEAMRAGTRAFLEAARDPAFRRIVLVDGPSVLGSDEWRQLHGQYARATVRAALEGNLAAGTLPALPLEPLTDLFVGALYEAGHGVAVAADPPAVIETYVSLIIDGTMAALRERTREARPPTLPLGPRAAGEGRTRRPRRRRRK
jgi:AcrR family transcriptional regulator